ncbi:HlyD family efflux transporter periplasmic adaptor subunit [Demequina sp. TTPB684]|uniref:HlyD family efflux transporter periplasmic adaptor subunit n=1 Tax=unclassified Demequina TaxID=2620311 RepID=UPI001CF4D0D8|nr:MULTISPECIES: HlyD family efflux transporter periplasmic adaptor subunit [unclassified Demequina]MCB2412985.1 HlyD family efflux transporter periplasmic adaptor subunit [Demequina sp. TTPB684]UPU88330.1 HlyD family efflux transporter periplasmic adaptor subunit [Demequina sp. TMPB413]
MTWTNRFRLLFGTVVVLILVAGATFVFTQRQAQVVSVTAQIVAETYSVGADYPGVVTHRYVEVGDHVEQNEPLFVVESLQVARDVESGLLDSARDDVSADGTLTVRAAVAGTVRTFDVNEGSYLSSGVVVATIEQDESLSARAEFVLAPRDFGRIEEAAEVELLLPDQREIPGALTDIEVITVDGYAHVTTEISSTGLVAGDANGLVRSGTPLEARLHLRDDGPLAGMRDAAVDFVRKIGL